MKVLVTGGRDYRDREAVYRVLDAMHRRLVITCIVHGNARGVDSYAGGWALLNKIAIERFPIKQREWDELGNAAGPARNARMLAESKPDWVVAFPGGTGTEDMVRRSKGAHVKVFDLRDVYD